MTSTPRISREIIMPAKLFAGEAPAIAQFSTEEFVSYYQNANTVSMEALTDYLHAIRDKVSTLSDKLFSNTDITLLDATADRFQVQSVLKRVHFSDLAPEIVNIPERFNGEYVEYLRTLTAVSKEAVPEVIQLLNNIKMAISGFINEYSEDGVMAVYGKSYSEASEKLIAKQKEKVTKFFPTNKANSAARVKEVIRKNGDIETLFNEVKHLESAINHDKLNEINKIAMEVSEMVDTLIEQNSKSGILLKNDKAKRDLVEMIHVGATGVEFVSYLYANTVYFYKALKSLSDKVLVVGNR